MYLLVLSLLLMLGRDLIDPRVWRLALGLSALCGLLTLGRAGVAAAAAVIFGIASLSSHRARWLTFLAFPALTAAVVIQLLTIFHIDAMHSILACNGEYAVERQTQYFGWYKEPGMCRFSFEGGVAYSSYFLLKLVALNAWLSEPYLGIGVCQFADAWRSAAGVDVPGYFANDLFTMSQCTYLTLLAEVGLLGTAAWFSLIGLFLWRTWTGARKNISTQWVFLTWAACFFYAMVDLDVQNFRFLYSLLPLAATMSVHAASKSVRTEAHQEG
jgi:O-antigen ligase